MFLVIGYGILYGLFLSMMIGPVFFALIRTSMDKGFGSAAYLASGTALSDALAAVTVYYSTAQIVQNDQFQIWIGGLGGTLMIIFGLSPFLRPVNRKKFLPRRSLDGVKGIRFVMEGILLNLLNPFVYIFWFNIISFQQINAAYTPPQYGVFIVSTILTVFASDLIKAYIAHSITPHLNAQTLTNIDRVAGIGLIGVGIRLLVFAIWR